MSAFVHLYYPHNLLPALAAVRESGEGGGTRLFLSPSGATPEASYSRMAGTVEQLVSRFPGVTGVEDARATQVRDLRARHASPSALFFAHDLLGTPGLDALFRAFPRAKRVAYGDSLGTVYSRRAFAELQGLPAPGRVRPVLRAIFSRSHEAQIASLLIPVDAGGDFLAGKTLRVPEPAIARDVVRTMLQGWPALEEYLAGLAGRAPHLLLLGNLVEAGLATVDGEIELFRAVVERNVPAGSAVVIKAHPGQDPGRVDRLAESLRSHWKVEVFDPRFLFVPVEVAETLVRKARVLSISYSTISLRYLFDTQVTHALDADLIERFILPEKRKWALEGDRMYTSIVRALDGWDGKSVILSGATRGAA